MTEIKTNSSFLDIYNNNAKEDSLSDAMQTTLSIGEVLGLTAYPLCIHMMYTKLNLEHPMYSLLFMEVVVFFLKR